MKIRVDDLSFGYERKNVLESVSLDVPASTLFGVVGPNGSGKSTLLKLLAGLLRPASGAVAVGDRAVASLSRAEAARLIGVVPQSCTPTFPVSVELFVGLGRYARESLFGGASADDRLVVARSLEELGITELAARLVDELSGGEFRRVLIAQALAQEPSVLLFDEPVQQLDLRHQLEVMAIARRFSKQEGRTGVVVLHELGLAARFCDRLALLHGGRVLAVGTPREVLTAENLRTAYGVEAVVRDCAETGALDVIAVAPRS